ncbi:MAG: hypothetical protein Q4P15_01965 [Propionibacteriaceae bacterium]|nr:hypothetical protein [Propionibacteriaceae bacterium]
MTNPIGRIARSLGLGLAILLALGVPVAAEEPDPTASAAPGFAAGEFEDGSVELRAQELLVADLMAQLEDARSLLKHEGAEDIYFDPGTRTATVLATEISPELRLAADQFNVTSTSSFRVVLELTQYTRDDWDALADDLLNNTSGWSDGLPGKPGGGYMVDKGYVALSVMDYDDPDVWVEAARRRAGDRVVVQVARDPEAGTAEEARNNDPLPRTGGSSLTFGASGCTAGFNWREWGSGRLLGSTAQHCYGTSFYNNGNLWGTTVGSGNFTADVRGLSGSNQYGPTVYVGTTTTNDKRTVVTAKASWVVGDIVAFGGGRSSGYSTAYVTNPNYVLPSGISCGQNRRGVLMDRHNTTGGDSGGPWLTARSDLKIIAHGQHYGYDICLSGNSFFIPVNTISGGLGASILTGS